MMTVALHSVSHSSSPIHFAPEMREPHQIAQLRSFHFSLMDQDEKFQKEIAPFFWVDHTESASVCLTVGEFLQDLFDTRQADGFDGGGYDWASLAKVFIDETCPELASKI